MSDRAYLERYLLNHGAGMFPDQEREVAAALAGFAHDWCRPDNWDLGLSKRAEFLSLWAEELGAAEQNLCTTENVTTGLHSVLGSLPNHVLEGKKLLIGADCFPSLHFLLSGLQERFGFTLVTVQKNARGFVDDEGFLSGWDQDVGLALITWVSSTTSHRVDLSAMVGRAREMGSWVGADITQGVGIVPIDVADVGLDFTICTSLKWMCGTPGAGVIYMHADRIAESEPELRGWFSQPDPFRWDLDGFSYAEGAARLQNGTPSLVANYGSIPGLHWRTAVGRENIYAQNRLLTAKIRFFAGERGWIVPTPEDPEKHGGSIMIQLPEGSDMDLVQGRLQQTGFTADHRGTTMRFSPGYTTSEDAVDELCALLADILPS